MKDILPDPAKTEIPVLVSLTELASTVDLDDSQASLTVLNIATEVAFTTVFTEQGADVTAHFLDRTETWAGAYVHCLGDSCPACKAQIDRKRFLLLPVADRTDGLIKVIRLPVEKGPGRL